MKVLLICEEKLVVSKFLKLNGGLVRLRGYLIGPEVDLGQAILGFMPRAASYPNGESNPLGTKPSPAGNGPTPGGMVPSGSWCSAQTGMQHHIVSQAHLGTLLS